MLRRLNRQLAFAVRIPPRQIARRLWLAARHRAEAALRPRLDAGVLTRAIAPPTLLFAPRQGLAMRDAAGWKFNFLNREIDAPEPIDWRAPDAGPRDQLWRMNLHYMEFLEALPDDAFCDLVMQWIAANPPFAPGGTADAWNAYALSLRTTIWMQQLAERLPALPILFVARVEASLATQLLYLERHLETDIGGNHLIKNIKALLWASAYFDGPAAERWRRKGLALLAHELPRQILPDGVHFELSPSYHDQVFADLLEIRHALGADPLNGALDAALARAAQATAELAHPDGFVAQFGDAGLHMAYAPAACLDAYDFLFGTRPAASALFALKSAGYFGARDGGAYVIADAGAIAPGALPAHGHGDMLSFEYSFGGERLIVDQGVFEYVAGTRRQASRACGSHNTLALAGMDQADFYGAFRCGRRGEIALLDYAPSGRGFVLDARHDGFRRLAGGPLHRRRFIVHSPEHVRIEDLLEGPHDAEVRVTLLLHPDAVATQISADRYRLSRGASAALVTASGPLTVESAFWWPDMGVERATSRLVLSLAAGARESWIEIAGLEPAPEGQDI